MTEAATMTRARRGDRRRSAAADGVVDQASGGPGERDNDRKANREQRESVRPVRSRVTTRYVGQCQRYISYEIAPTQRTGSHDSAAPSAPGRGWVRRQSTIAVATQ